MCNQVSQYRAGKEVAMIYNEEVREKIRNLREHFSDIIDKAEDGTLTGEEYALFADEFNELTTYSSRDDNILKATLFLIDVLDIRAANHKTRSIRKTKGSYSLPDKVIDGVIANIVYGEKVEDACSYAGITAPTLYNRIRDRGYTDIKEFFKMKRRELKGDN